MSRPDCASGSYTVFAYDNNVVASTDLSNGWDGGNLFIVDSTGCGGMRRQSRLTMPGVTRFV